MSDQKRYTIRQVGYILWEDADTIAEAIQLRAEAQDRLGRQALVIIYDNELEREVTSE